MSETMYRCVFRSTCGRGCWVSFVAFNSEETARANAKLIGIPVVAFIAINPGIRPPVGMTADQCSHRWDCMDPWGANDWDLVPR